MRVVTISRSYGSAGSLFGKKLAERLGYHYVDERYIVRMKTNKEATAVLMMNLEDEKSPGFLDRLGELMNNRSYFRTALGVALYDLVLKRDIVVVGGGGHLILQGYSSKISLQIYRNLFDRVQDIANEKGIGQDEALDLIEKKDKEKKKFISYYFDEDLFDPASFDITFNASFVNLDNALDMMESYCKRYFDRVDTEEAEKFAAARLLEKRAQLAVFHMSLMKSGKISFDVPEPGVLMVNGIIGGLEEKGRLLKGLRSLKGVDKVIDKLKTGVLSRMLY
jgi:cytidylate kinase